MRSRRARAAVDDYAAWYEPTVPRRRHSRSMGPARHGRTTGRVAGTAPAQRDCAVLPVRHGGGRAAPRRARQPEPPQRRALSRPRLADQAADPRRTAGPTVTATSSTTHWSASTPDSPGSTTRPQHPWQTVVEPDRSRAESYSWATAPRYGDDDRVMQLGPLPELLIAGDPLAVDLVAVHGTSAFVRQLVRWTRAAANLRLVNGGGKLTPSRQVKTDPWLVMVPRWWPRGRGRGRGP